MRASLRAAGVRKPLRQRSRESGAGWEYARVSERSIYMKISREEVRKVKCPKCGAEPSKKCFKRSRYADGQVEVRESNHQERIRKALDAGAATNPVSRMTFTVQGTASPVRTRVRDEQRVSRWMGLEPATREQTRGEPCEDCGARPGQPCLGVVRLDGSRRAMEGHHSSRWAAAMRRLGRAPRPDGQ